MPRELLSIKTFFSGLVMSPDITDIPPDAASWSRNIDGDSRDGALVSRCEDELHMGLTHGIHTAEWLTRLDGTHNLVTYHSTSSTDSSLRIIENFYSEEPTDRIIKSSSNLAGKMPVFTRNSNEVRVGWAGDEEPLFIGYGKRPPISGLEQSEGLIVAPARLNAPKRLPAFYKSILMNDGTHDFIIGIEWKGDKIWKYNVQHETIYFSDFGTYNALTAISDDPSDTTIFWIFDSGQGQRGTVHKVELSTLDILLTWNIAEWPNQYVPLGADDQRHLWVADEIVSDMEVSSTMVFLARYSSKINVSVPLAWEEWVYRVPKTTPSTVALGAPTLVNCTPLFHCEPSSYEPGDPGVWISSGTISEAFCVNPTGPLFFKRSLTRVKKFSIGGQEVICVGWTFSTNTASTYFCTNSSSPPKAIGVGIYLIEDSAVKGFPGAVYRLNSDEASGAQFNGAYLAGDAGEREFIWVNGKTVKLRHSFIHLYKGNMAGEFTDLSTPDHSATLNYEARTVGHTSSHFILQYYAASALHPELNTPPDFVQLDQADLGGLATYVSQDVVTISPAAVTPDSTSETFDENYNYHYKVAFIYDDYQMSPLCPHSTVYGGDATRPRVTITITNLSALPARVTGIALFRAECLATSSDPVAGYRLLKQLFFSSNPWVYTLGGDGFTYSATISYEDLDKNSFESSYFEITGIEETLSDSMVSYHLGVVYGNELIVGDCRHNEIPDAPFMLFKSRPGRFDMFNWPNDFLRLPFVPKALSVYKDKVYAFDDNQIYKIDANKFIVEEIIPGAGADNPYSVVSTDHGLYFCTKQDIWHYDGTKLFNIGIPIRTKDTNAPESAIAWRDCTHEDFGPKVYNYGKKNSIVFYVNPYNEMIPPSRKRSLYIWNIPRRRWDYWTLNDDSSLNYLDNTCLISGQLGELYHAWSTNLSHVDSGVQMQDWEWYSPQYHFGEPSQGKKISRVRYTTTGTSPMTIIEDTLSTETDNCGSFFSVVASTGEICNEYVPGQEPEVDRDKHNFLRVRVMGATDFFGIRSLDIIYRPLIGKR